MRIFRQYQNIPDECRGTVVALGNFDGFHRGHQAVIAAAADVADRLGKPLGVVTMEPHPRRYFKPDSKPFRLTPFRAKAHHLQVFGVDVLTVLHFDASLSHMSAQDFVLKVLIEGLGVTHVVTGYDYRFGKGRGGGVDVLSWMGLMEGYGLTIVEPVSVGRKETGDSTEKVYSSSIIRKMIEDGKVRDAASMLGHWWTIDGIVTKGEQRGRKMAFPTINLPMTEYLEPRLGVYAVRVHISEGPDEGCYNAVANIGLRPTFGHDTVILEAHILDLSADLYGLHVEIELVDFIRPEQKFDGLESLKQQIAKDCVKAAGLLARADNQRDLLPSPRLARGIQGRRHNRQL